MGMGTIFTIIPRYGVKDCSFPAGMGMKIAVIPREWGRTLHITAGV